jgi:hypothetical protein
MTSPGKLILAVTATALLFSTGADAQTYGSQRARRQWVTVSYGWLYTHLMRFAHMPLEDLVGTEVAVSREGPFDYHTRDGLTQIDVLEIDRRGAGGSITVYPLGMSVGPALGVRASIDELPDIRMAFEGPGPLDSYALTNARAYDLGVGLFVSDRSAGWGLGSYAFIVGGVGRIRSDLGDGDRYFAEGGGGLQSGPVGFELAVKFGWNRFNQPVEHEYLTVPITLRGTLSF